MKLTVAASPWRQNWDAGGTQAVPYTTTSGVTLTGLGLVASGTKMSHLQIVVCSIDENGSMCEETVEHTIMNEISEFILHIIMVFKRTKAFGACVFSFEVLS